MSTAVWPSVPKFWRRRGIKPVQPGVLEITAEPQPATSIGRAWCGCKRFLLGEPFKSSLDREQRLGRLQALALIGSDSIASSVYGPESMMRALVFAAGIGALAHASLITAGILVLLAVVAISYRQTISAYPNGGGSYVVSRENLGVNAGLVAGVALMIDYILNVSVSVAGGIESITSVFPEAHPYKVALCLGAIVILTVGNLRGNKSSAWLFSGPVYLYILSTFTVIGIGVYRWATGTLPQYQPNASDVAHLGGATAAVSAMLLLRSFASGAVALSGVEAMSNGVPAFREPETSNAKQTLTWMALIFGALFAGLTFLASRMQVVPDPNEVETLVSRVARTIIGVGPFYWVVQGAAALMLAIAANTSYADFPRLANIMSLDRYLPARFSLKGHRLAFSSGILFLSVLAALLVIGFEGSMARLVPLFTIGVFISFTMSEVGMVVHHWRLREGNWRYGLTVNGIGAVVTGSVAIVEGVTKFDHGAWAILVLIPTLVFVLLRIRKHFDEYDREMTVPEPEMASREMLGARLKHHVLIPIENMTRADLFALGYVRSLVGPNVRKVEAVHVSHDPESAARLREQWDRAKLGVPLTILESPYRTLVEPLLSYIDMLRRKSEDGRLLVDVFLPEPMPSRLWHQFLHKKTTLLLKAVLLVRPGVTVTSIPYHFRS